MRESPIAGPEPDPAGSRGVAAVEVAAALLRALKEARRPLSLKALADATGLTRPRAHHQLASLRRAGLVEQHAPTREYWLGPFAMELGLAAADRNDLQHACAPWLRALSQRTGFPSFFTLWTNRGALIVRWEEGERAHTVHARLGTIMPLARGATGVVYLAWPPPDLGAVWGTELRRVPPARRAPLVAGRELEAEQARRRGYSTTRDSIVPGIHAVAGPVFGPGSGSGAGSKRRLLGVVALLGPSAVFDLARSGPNVRALLDVTRRFGEAVSKGIVPGR